MERKTYTDMVGEIMCKMSDYVEKNNIDIDHNDTLLMEVIDKYIDRLREQSDFIKANVPLYIENKEARDNFISDVITPLKSREEKVKALYWHFLERVSSARLSLFVTGAIMFCIPMLCDAYDSKI